MKTRPSLRTCSSAELVVLQRALHGVDRKELIFAAGVLGNERLGDQLGSMELSHYYEGRRAIDPEFKNPYWREA